MRHFLAIAILVALGCEERPIDSKTIQLDPSQLSYDSYELGDPIETGLTRECIVLETSIILENPDSVTTAPAFSKTEIKGGWITLYVTTWHVQAWEESDSPLLYVEYECP